MINIEQLSVFTINPYKNLLYESTFRLLATLDTNYIPLGTSSGQLYFRPWQVFIKNSKCREVKMINWTTTEEV